ncbi:MAG: N-acetylmuramoyl-L-alanine amidase [Fusobacteriaceae bacterium]
MKKMIVINIVMIILLTSCSSLREKKFKINETKYRAENFDNRIKGIILHYTAIDNEKSIRALTKGRVSSHYLLTDNDQDPIYSIVEDQKRAWHAGKSEFLGRQNLNDSTIGIEIVNLGYKLSKNQFHPQVKKFGSGKEAFIDKKSFYDYTEVQIEKTGFLVKYLVEKYDISPKMILGHSDIAPNRKKDPGPLFPWKRLYDEYGVGAWYEHSDKLFYMNADNFSRLSVEEIKNEFKKYGYKISENNYWDVASTQVVYSFQMHFRPENIDGVVDLETYSILKALNKKYK